MCSVCVASVCVCVYEDKREKGEVVEEEALSRQCLNFMKCAILYEAVTVCLFFFFSFR